MHTNAYGVFQQLAALSLEKCLLRLSRVSAGTWRVLGIKVTEGTLADAIRQHEFKHPASAVHFTVKAESALTALILFDREDIECISRAFTGHSFPKGPRTTPAEEVILLELGNIILNALVSSVLNALKRSSIPAVPQYLEGDADSLVGGLGEAGSAQKANLIKATLAIQCGESETTSEIFAVVPDEMALSVEQAASAGKIFSL